MNFQKISVITPSLNRAGMIEIAVESVLAQQYPIFEHIIVDGGSTDGTLDILKKYAHLKVIVHKDSGMYDALNRGVACASGSFICFLNTDDRFLPNSFTQAIVQFNDQNPDAVIGQATMVQSEKILTREILCVRPDHWWNTLILGIPIFNAWFFRREVFDQLGEFDTRFKIAGDRDYLIRFGMANLKPGFVNHPLYEYSVHKGSLSLGRKPSDVYRMCTENLWLVDKWQGQVSNLPQINLYLQLLARREIAEMVIQAIKDKAVRKGILYIRRGIQREPAFIPFLIKKIISGIRSRSNRLLCL